MDRVGLAERYLEQLEPLLQAQPPQPEKIRAVLAEAKQQGYSPARLYLGALRLHDRHYPLPPSPRDVMPD